MSQPSDIRVRWNPYEWDAPGPSRALGKGTGYTGTSTARQGMAWALKRATEFTKEPAMHDVRTAAEKYPEAAAQTLRDKQQREGQGRESAPHARGAR